VPRSYSSPEIASEAPALRSIDFARIRSLAYQKFGLDLKGGKEELVSARLGKMVRNGGFQSLDEYYKHVVGDASGEALIGMIDALATNFTSFYREPAHFEFLAREIVPGWKERRQIRIWSAACSSGEEPYTLAFSLLEQLGGATQPALSILATDISTKALQTAQRGVYPAERFESVPAGWMRRFLLRGQDSSKGLYKVKPEVQLLIRFQRLNLIEPLPQTEPFALILCRNVMIYFDKPTQQRVVDRLADCLEPGGYLFVGHSESLAGLRPSLDYVCPAVYRKPPEGASPPRRMRTRP
jgi:chemotaxis protein methyltransferase CheR